MILGTHNIRYCLRIQHKIKVAACILAGVVPMTLALQKSLVEVAVGIVKYPHCLALVGLRSCAGSVHSPTTVVGTGWEDEEESPPEQERESQS